MNDDAGFSGKLTLAFQVRDRKASSRWYEEVLGCRLLYDAEEMSWCELASPVPEVAIGLSDEGPVRPGGPVPTFEVHDLDGFRRELENRGVRFEAETVVVEGIAKLATFFDPDDHRLMLAQDLQGGDR